MKNYKSKYSKILTKEFLYTEYIINNKSVNQIAKEIKGSVSNLSYYLNLNNIPRRTLSEARKDKFKGNNAPGYKDGRSLKSNYCIGCGKEVYDYRVKRCLSCASKHNILIRRNNGTLMGKKAAHYIDGRTNKKYFCLDCGKEISVFTGFYGLGRCQQCDNIQRKIRYKGKNNPNYIERLIRVYPNKFNEILKESIRQRDNHQCQICGKSTKKNSRKLDVHHIDYDKFNLNTKNLISLCQSCHIQSNGNREIYIEYFKILKEIIHVNN